LTNQPTPAAALEALEGSQPRRRRGSGARRQPVFMLLPGIAVLLVFFGVPVLDILQTSLSRWSGIGQGQFIGLDNYTRLLQDPRVISALGRSVTLGVCTALGIGVVATLMAAMVSRGIRGSRFYRIAWFLPAIAPPSAVAVFWALSVQPRSGAVNAVLGAIGLGNTHAWLADSSTALWVVVFVAIWGGVGFAFLVILGAMEDVPIDIYEAAALDGASPVQAFFKITLPLIRPVLSMIVLLNVIWAFNGFTLVWGMTQGGPGDATTILPAQVYRDAFKFGNFGLAAATSVVGGVILLLIGLVGHYLGSRRSADS
jgi:ABC-type sugar transport system permease subunit